MSNMSKKHQQTQKMSHFYQYEYVRTHSTNRALMIPRIEDSVYNNPWVYIGIIAPANILAVMKNHHLLFPRIR